MIALAVFDLDGTLVDSRRDLSDAANALVAGLGGTPLGEDAIAAMVGEGARVLVSRVLAAAGLDPRTPSAFEQFLEHYDARLVACSRCSVSPASSTASSVATPLAAVSRIPRVCCT